MEGKARGKCSLRDRKELHHHVGETDGGGSQLQLKPFTPAVCSGSRCSSPARCAEHQGKLLHASQARGKKKNPMLYHLLDRRGKILKLHGCLPHSDGPPGLTAAPAKTLAYVITVSPAEFLYWYDLPTHLYLCSVKGFFTSTKKTKLGIFTIQ